MIVQIPMVVFTAGIMLSLPRVSKTCTQLENISDSQYTVPGINGGIPGAVPDSFFRLMIVKDLTISELKGIAIEFWQARLTPLGKENTKR